MSEADWGKPGRKPEEPEARGSTTEEVIPPEAVRHYREEAGMTQEELAEEAGVGQTHISEIELGNKEPSFSLIRRLTEVLLDGPEGE